MVGSLQDQVNTFFNVLGRLRPLAIVLVGTALVGIAVAKLSVTMGVRFGLVFCVLLCGLIGWVCSQIHMKNVAR